MTTADCLELAGGASASSRRLTIHVTRHPTCGETDTPIAPQLPKKLRLIGTGIDEDTASKNQTNQGHVYESSNLVDN